MSVATLADSLNAPADPPRLSNGNLLLTAWDLPTPPGTGYSAVNYRDHPSNQYLNNQNVITGTVPHLPHVILNPNLPGSDCHDHLVDGTGCLLGPGF